MSTTATTRRPVLFYTLKHKVENEETGNLNVVDTRFNNLADARKQAREDVKVGRFISLTNSNGTFLTI